MTKRILFVCLGNICRSPAAEAVFLDLLQRKGLDDQYQVDSAGTGGWHVGKPADLRMRNAAKKRGIMIKSIARSICSEDFDAFDFILTMDDSNFNEVNFIASKLDNKNIATIKPIMFYSKSKEWSEVPDPYYGGEKGFEEVLDLLNDACTNFLEVMIMSD